jgi:hypothetical protein
MTVQTIDEQLLDTLRVLDEPLHIRKLLPR